MFIVMEHYHLPIVGINPGKCNDRTTKIAIDIFNNGFGVTEIELYINVKFIFMFMVNVGFCFFKGGAEAFFNRVANDA